MESTARTPSTAREFQDTASPAVVSLYSVVPALIATKEGGATPVDQPGGIQVSQWIQIIQQIIYRQSEGMDILTKKGTEEENPQRHVDDRRGDVDEPVGKEGGDPQEDDVIN